MADKRGCTRNRILRGGGSTVYSLAGSLLPGVPLNNAYPVVNDIGCGAAARPMVNPGQPGLPGMSGGRRRRHAKRKGRKVTRRRTQRGGRYGFDLSPQMTGAGYNPNQFATVVGMRGETCTPFNRNQIGGAMVMSPAPYPPTMTLDQASYQAAYEVPKTVYTQVAELIPQGGGGNVVPIERNDALGAAQISGACKQTGGRRRSRRSRKGKKSHRRRSHRKH